MVIAWILVASVVHSLFNIATDETLIATDRREPGVLAGLQRRARELARMVANEGRERGDDWLPVWRIATDRPRAFWAGRWGAGKCLGLHLSAPKFSCQSLLAAVAKRITSTDVVDQEDMGLTSPRLPFVRLMRGYVNLRHSPDASGFEARLTLAAGLDLYKRTHFTSRIPPVDAVVAF